MKIERLETEILTNQCGECVATAHFEGLQHAFYAARRVKFGPLLMKNMHDYLWIYGVHLNQIFVRRFGYDVLSQELVSGEMLRIVGQNDLRPAFDGSGDDMAVFRIISHCWNKLFVAICYPGICKMLTQLSDQIVSIFFCSPQSGDQISPNFLNNVVRPAAKKKPPF